MKTIGILCSNSSDIYLANAIYLLQQGLSKHGYETLLCCTGYEAASKIKYLKLLVSKRVDAIFILGSDFVNEKDNKYLIETAKKMPIFLLNSYIKANNIYSVVCDDEEIVYKTTFELISKNKPNILFINRMQSFSGKQKLLGFKKAYEENNISLQSWQIATINDDTQNIVAFLNSLNKNGCKFDAVITSDDELAIAVIKYAKKENISIPNDLIVIGYNNSRLTQYCEPELSSIDNKLESCCEMLILALTNLLDGKQVPNKTAISAEIIHRKTTV